MITYKQLREGTLTLKRKPDIVVPPKHNEASGPGYEPGKKPLTPDEKRQYGFHVPDENAKHPNEGKPSKHGERAEYHYGWEVVHTTHGKDRQTGGERSSTLALPGKFKNPHDNNKDFTHRMIRGVHWNRLNKNTEVRFTSKEHDHTVVANVDPHNKQFRIMTVLPKGHHAKGESSNKDRQIRIESADLFDNCITIDLDECDFQIAFNQLISENLHHVSSETARTQDCSD